MVVIVGGDALKGNNAETSYNTPTDDYQSDDADLSYTKIPKYDTDAKSGSPGINGQTGGQVTVASAQTETSNSILLSGYSSIGGYGGDGANGTYNIYSGVALGGGAGGKAGEKGSSGQFRENGDIDQLNGNGGIGGFGRITKNGSYFAIRTSGNGGSQVTETDEEGNEVTKLISGSNGGWYSGMYGGEHFEAYFASRISQLCYQNKSHFSNSYHNWNIATKCHEYYNDDKSVDYGYEYALDALVVNGNSKKYGGITGGGSAGLGNSVMTTKIYFYSHIHADYYAFKGWKVNDNCWYRVSWTSGETVNGAGGFTDCYGNLGTSSATTSSTTTDSTTTA
jgi:hypothetical protein